MAETIVTCFYPIRSKFPPQQYIEWARRFMRLAKPIVLFTVAELSPLFRELRGDRPMHIVETPFEELDTWVRYKDRWIADWEQDHEKAHHTPELYAIWAQKAFFVDRAASLNPFNCEHFFWCDIGALRTEVPSGVYKNFPDLARFPADDRIIMSSVHSLEDNDTKKYEDGIVGNFRYVDRIVGGLWGGNRHACKRWLQAYTKELEAYFCVGRFAGKDQSVMLSAYLADRSLAYILQPALADVNPWFFLLHFMSDWTVKFTLDPTFI